MNNFVEHYEAQVGGGGGGGIGGGGRRVYVGLPYQRGHGIGSFLGGAFRAVLPLLTRGAKTLGKEALRTGLNIATDVAAREIPLKRAVRARLTESHQNLKRRAANKIEHLMEGSGYKKGRVAKRKKHSPRKRATVPTRRKTRGKTARKTRTVGSGKRKTKRKTTKRRVSDIFG